MIEWIKSIMLRKLMHRGIKPTIGLFSVILLACLSAPGHAEVELKVSTDRPAHTISPMMYGLFNWSPAAETETSLLQIRSDNSVYENNPNYLRLMISKGKKMVGIVNSGYGGFAVEKAARYRFSAYLRAAGQFDGNVFVCLENKAGEILGQSSVNLDREREFNENAAVITLKGSTPKEINTINTLRNVYPKKSVSRELKSISINLNHIL